jgi:hypothetical protein
MTWTTYSGPGNASCGFNQPTRSYCGNGWGRGGTAYAGGAGQCCVDVRPGSPVAKRTRDALGGRAECGASDPVSLAVEPT